MIDEKAFHAAWESVGWDTQNPQAEAGQRRFIAAYEANRYKHPSVRAHQDYCGLDTDHKGPCVATFARDIGTQHSTYKLEFSKVDTKREGAVYDGIAGKELMPPIQNPENQKHEHIWDMSISGDRRCCTCGISSKT